MVTILTGTTPYVRDMFLEKRFDDMHDIMYFSDNIETAEHYAEGCIIEIDIDLDKSDETDYIILNFETGTPNTDWDLSDYYYGSDVYKFVHDGTPITDVHKPENYYEAICYSINKKYLQKHCKAVRIIK